MAASRIYAIRDRNNHAMRLVEATSPAQALRHIAGALFEVTVASPKQIAALCQNGTKVEKAHVVEEPAGEDAAQR
jgi:hypothetical protein